MWRRIIAYRRPLDTLVHEDYAQADKTDGDGVTLRFGDGVFGAIPSPTASPGTVFEVSYRLGNGIDTNLGADTLVVFDVASLGGLVADITNPLPTEGGSDAEALDAVRRDAPDAFRAVTYRAVRPEDYAEAAERLDWVQRAGSEFRWTGSWLSAMVTPDPRGTDTLTEDRRDDLQAQLDRFRQAGRETIVPDPVYADIDLRIEICVAPTRYGADVVSEVETVLLGTKGPFARHGFFDPDNFTFGTPLYRSRLEAAIMDVPGVKAVERMAIRRRGWFDWRPFTELTYAVEPNEVIRLDNDPQHPDRGTLRLFHEGGA
jgi:predicted phage baseplate assembly protein